MPSFIYQEKEYNNPVELVLDKLGGRWKMPILWRLKDKVWRYGQLRKSFEKNNSKITHQMLTKQLRQLEADGFIHRKVYPEVPPKVEYSITGKGRETIPIITVLREYGLRLMVHEGIDTGKE